MAARKQVLEPGTQRRKPRGASRKMNYGNVRGALLEALRQGAQLSEACRAANVTARQVQYYAENSPKFRAEYDAAKASGHVAQLMPPETLKRFLAACEWLCGIDVAREAIGLMKSELSKVFAARPDILEAAKAAQAEGRKIIADENGEPSTRQIWGRAKLARLLNEALAMQELS